ncbi:hypothetical protein AAGQ96_13040 [Pantoea sp. MBD-2R]|uniref:hypothetical protein n=1 Tax=Pantoea sp. MBD-2R TaxID=3141540 RepID=UPI003183E217
MSNYAPYLRHLANGSMQLSQLGLEEIADSFEALEARVKELEIKYAQEVIDHRDTTSRMHKAEEELAAQRDWVKCVEAERDKAIHWHSSLRRKYEQLTQPSPVAPAVTASIEISKHVAIVEKVNRDCSLLPGATFANAAEFTIDELLKALNASGEIAE